MTDEEIQRMHCASEFAIALAKQSRDNDELQAALRRALPLMRKLYESPMETALEQLETELNRAFYLTRAYGIQ